MEENTIPFCSFCHTRVCIHDNCGCGEDAILKSGLSPLTDPNWVECHCVVQEDVDPNPRE